MIFEYWWLVNVGYIIEEDIKVIFKFLFIFINEIIRDRDYLIFLKFLY